jgi:hypothetical protein
MPLPTPIRARTGLAKDAIPVSKNPVKMAGSSPATCGRRLHPAMMGMAARAVREQQGRLAGTRAKRSESQAACRVSIFCAISVSAICTAFNAAPFLRLSETHQNDSPCGTVGSLRIRLTYTASSPAHSSGVA